MKSLVLSLLISTSVFAQTRPAPPRFSVDLVQVETNALPGLHSYVAAQGSGGKWLLAGGRTNGLHHFVESSKDGSTPPPNAFPVANANRNLVVIDPIAKKSWSSSLTALPVRVADALSTTNAEGAQSGNVLYVIGGYGWDSATQTMITFPTLTAIKVDETINAIVSGKPVASFIQQTSTYFDCLQFASNAYNTCLGPLSAKCQPGATWQQCQEAAAAACRIEQAKANDTCAQNVLAGKTAGLPTNTGYYARVAGGGMEKVGNAYYLVFGQNFEGLYSVNEGDYGKWPVNQIYTEQVVALAFRADPLAAAVLAVAKQDPNDLSAPYHRRDLNVLPALAPDGTERIAVHGGVFVPGQNTAYRAPITIEAPSPTSMRISVDTYQQFFNQYECATVTMFDRNTGGSLTNVFIGGITLYYWDPVRKQMHADTSLPFTNNVSALTRLPDGTWSEYVRATPLPGYIGTNAKFLRNPRVAAAGNGVIYFDAIKERTLVGWMYGGILAERQNAGSPSGAGSTASPQLFEVWIDPTPPGSAYWLSAPGSAPAQPAP